MELFSSYMPAEHDYWQVRRDVSTIFVPYWIRQLLERNRIDYIELLNYDKLRAVLSLEDMAQLLCLNVFFKHYVVKDLRCDETGLSTEWCRSQSEKFVAEFNDVIIPLAQAETTINAVHDRLSFDEGGGGDVLNYLEDPLLKVDGQDQSKQLHRIIPLHNRAIAVVLEKGILNTLEVRDVRFAMISEYLKALYAALPIREVSKYYGAFAHYINML